MSGADVRDKIITFFQVAIILLLLRLVMVNSGMTFIRIPILDPMLGKLDKKLRDLSEEYFH